MTEKDKIGSIILAPISLGELIDKITILEIKKEHMIGTQKKNVEKELKSLVIILESKKYKIDSNLIIKLKEVNKSLWEIEDQIREKENKKDFKEEFIKLARSVYKENDRRANIKKEINQKYNSSLIEEKFYKSYE